MCQWVKLNKCSIEKKNIFLSDKLSENYISCGILITLAKVFELSVICTTLNTHFGSIYVKMRKFIADIHFYKMYFKGISQAKWCYVEQIL